MNSVVPSSLWLMAITSGPFRSGPGMATHLLEPGQDSRTIQNLLGCKDLNPRLIYTHVLNCGPLGVRSSADLL